MRKLIRYSALAFLVWAVTTFAWAALSHATGLVGPAEASGASLRFVAGAVTLVDPPGVLGAPQRLAASQIRHAARAVERIHRGPERAMARVLDRFGHDARHRGHRHRHAVRIERDGRSLEIPLDELDGARERAMTRARIELERHRRGLERGRRDLERGRSSLDRERWRRAVEVRRQEQLRRRVELVRERLQGVEVEQDGELKRKLVERLREILRELERELEDVRVEQRLDVDVDVEPTEDIASRILESLEVELEAIGEEISGEAPVRIRIRGNGN